MNKDVLRVANCSGFYGDRLSAAREMVEGGDIDVLTGDYLAELTMAILARAKLKDKSHGYAATFVTQFEQVIASCMARKIKIVCNAGGLNPSALASRLNEVASKLGLKPRIACVTGDDLTETIAATASRLSMTHMGTGEPIAPILSARPILTASAYIGGWGIAEALKKDADVVITGRVTDAALVIGPSIWHFGWGRTDYDALAGALVAGHVIECGAQATGGNYAFFAEVPGLDHPGFPIAEIRRDGSSVITKHRGTGGLVSVGTVTAQLVYEIGDARYKNPDVTALFDTISLVQEGENRVRIDGTKGEPPDPTIKVAIHCEGGFRNSVTFVLTGLDIEAKANAARGALFHPLGGQEPFREVQVELQRTDRDDPQTNEQAFAYLKVTVRDDDKNKVGFRFSRKATEIGLSNYPGFLKTSPPEDATPFSRYIPSTIPIAEIREQIVIDGNVTDVSRPSEGGSATRPEKGADRVIGEKSANGNLPVVTTRAPIGRIVGARSGDKGGDANLGLWTKTDEAYVWLEHYLSIDRLKYLLAETRSLEVERHLFPNLRAINFVIHRLLDDGVSSTARTDPQAKSLGEYFRAKIVDVPSHLLALALALA